MHSGRSKFRLNKADGKVMGVCAGLADYFNVDPTLVRIAVAAGIIMTFPVGLIAYLILAIVAQSGATHSMGRRRHRHERSSRREPAMAAPRLSEASVEATRDRMRDLDARMQAIETYVTSSNSDLAREIEALR